MKKWKKKIYLIVISQNFYDNIINKGYLVFDSNLLLNIGSSIVRAIHILITKLRFNSSEVEKMIHSLLRSFSEENLQKGLEICSGSIKENFRTITYLENTIKYALEKNERKKEIALNTVNKKIIKEESEILKIKNEKLFDTEDWFSSFEKLDSNIKKIIKIIKIIRLTIKCQVKNKKT